jgi:hypothetical protein
VVALNFNCEVFDEFLSRMDDQIDWLESEAAKHNIPLSLSASCCESLEKLFDVLSKGKEKAELAGLSVAFARYLGEHVRQTHHGEWTLSLDDPKNVNFNTPVIIGHSAVPGLEFAPLAVMRHLCTATASGNPRPSARRASQPKTFGLERSGRATERGANAPHRNAVSPSPTARTPSGLLWRHRRGRSAPV